MKKLTILFVAILISLYSFSQNCIDTSYRKVFNSPNYILYNDQYNINKDGSSILAGVMINTITNDTAVNIIKLSPLNNILWAKEIKLPYKNYYIYASVVRDIVELQNGDIVLLYRPTLSSAATLIKLNSNGDLIWIRTITGIQDIGIGYARLYSFNDQVYLSFWATPSVGIDGNGIVKLDTAGSIVWNKYYSRTNCNITFPISMYPTNDSLIIIGRVYFGSCSTDETAGFPDEEQSYYAMKINDASGALGKSQSYLNTKDFNYLQNGFVGTDDFPADIIFNNQKGLYLIARTYPYNPNFGSYKIRFDTALNFYEGSLYYHTDVNLSRLSRLDIDSENNTDIIFYGGTFNPNQYIGKFSQDNNVIRQKDLGLPANSLSGSAGYKPFALDENYLRAVTNYTTAKGGYIQLTQLNNDEQNDSCFGRDTNFIKIAPFIITPYSSPFFNVAIDLPLQSNIVQATINDVVVNGTEYCTQINDCNNISISNQIDTICNLNQSYIFTAHLNVGCNKHVFWDIDTSAISVINIINDTTVQLQFKKQWSGFLFGSINSCSLIKDSIRLNIIPSPNDINFGNDTSFCFGNTFLLNAGAGFKNYRWQDNSADSIFTVNKSGKYFVTATDYCNNIFSDTISVKVDTPNTINLGNDTSICSNQQLLLNAGKGFISYQWNNGDTTQSITAKAIGNYSVSATDSIGCVAKDTLKIIAVFPAPVVSLNKNTVLCLNQNNVLHAGAGFATYLWQDGSADSNLVVTMPGFYKVTVSNTRNCVASDSVAIVSIATAPTNFLPADSAICNYETIIIEPTQLFNKYLWSTGSAANTILIQQPGIYWLQVEDNNLCIGNDTIQIAAKDCATHFFVPTSFTPNGDGLNDKFKPLFLGDIISYEFYIYNRYGQLVFKATDINTGWDGTFNNQKQNSGTFVWYCKYKANNEPEKFAKGTVILIR